MEAQPQKYRDTFLSKVLPKLCRKWSCWAIVLEMSHKYAQSGWAYLHSAWCCDDSRKGEAAIKQRSEAIRVFETARKSSDPFGTDLETETSILVDVYRRIGDFAHASELAQSVLVILEDSQNEEKRLMQTVNQFQLHLASIGNIGSYTYAEAEHYTKNPSKWHPPRWWEIWR